METSPWEEWMSFEVIDKCLEEYGATVFVAHSLYELTFFGYEASDVDRRVEKEKKILAERDAEVAKGTAELISSEEVFKELKELGLAYEGKRKRKKK